MTPKKVYRGTYDCHRHSVEQMPSQGGILSLDVAFLRVYCKHDEQSIDDRIVITQCQPVERLVKQNK